MPYSFMQKKVGGQFRRKCLRCRGFWLFIRFGLIQFIHQVNKCLGSSRTALLPSRRRGRSLCEIANCQVGNERMGGQGPPGYVTPVHVKGFGGGGRIWQDSCLLPVGVFG